MANLGIEDLPIPPKEFLASHVFPRFETKEEAIEEDQLRRRRIQALRSKPRRLKTPLTIGVLKRLEFSIAGAVIVGEVN